MEFLSCCLSICLYVGSKVLSVHVHMGGMVVFVVDVYHL